MKIVLASTSKQKNDILDIAHIKHIQLAGDFEEKRKENENVYKYVQRMSCGKAKSVENKCKDSIIIGLDTVCCAKGKILEKPKDIEEEKRNIRICQGSKAKVITGITVINQKTKQEITTFTETLIKMQKITDEEIDYYLKNEPNWKYAAGFIIETILSNFIKEIKGSYYNILGTPVETIYPILRDMGYILENPGK